MDRQPTIVISSDWIMAAEAEARLKIANRTLREWAQAGFIRWKRNPDPVRKRERLYSASDVEKLRTAGGPPRNRPSQARQLPAANIAPSRHERQEARALDTVSIVGQMLAALKADRDAERTEKRELVAAFAAEFEAARLERDAEREREKARREAELRRAEERARPWLTLQQAIEVSGLTAAAIRRAVKEEKLVAMKAGGLRIKRASLESL